MNQEKISVVIPVYNVIEYLDSCLVSVTEQTYQNLEIILVNDGSTDGSKEKCEEWARKDKRIVLMTQENCGQGIARNVGIKRATGTYLAFVDSDDWIHQTMMEKLHKRMVETASDITICDIFHVIQKENGKMQYVAYKIQANIDGITNATETAEIIYRTDTCLYDKLYRLDFWRRQNIEMPNHPYEDSVTVPLMMALANRVSYVAESLYYYNLHREGNTTSHVKNLPYIKQSLGELIEEAKEKQIFQQYKKAFMKYSFWMMRGIFYHLKKSKDEEEYRKYYDLTIPEMKIFMSENYPGWDQVADKNYVVWGSYNLRSELLNLLVNPSDLCEHFGFSSIIGFSESPHKNFKMDSANKFRMDMVNKEVNRGFYQMMKEADLDVDYVVVDLLEERYDIFRLNGLHATLSDALEEVNVSNFAGTLCLVDEKEHMQELKSWTIDFFEFLIGALSLERIILVKNMLCEQFGKFSEVKDYDNRNEIHKINRNLQEQYQWITDKFPKIKVIEVDEKYQYTDKAFVHGCKPEHMNTLAYWSVSDQIETYIRAQEKEKVK